MNYQIDNQNNKSGLFNPDRVFALWSDSGRATR
jgi:hypothetical protein